MQGIPRVKGEALNFTLNCLAQTKASGYERLPLTFTIFNYSLEVQFSVVLHSTDNVCIKQMYLRLNFHDIYLLVHELLWLQQYICTSNNIHTWSGLCIKGQLSHWSPTPSLSVSIWSVLYTYGQLSSSFKMSEEIQTVLIISLIFRNIKHL